MDEEDQSITKSIQYQIEKEKHSSSPSIMRIPVMIALLCVFRRCLNYVLVHGTALLSKPGSVCSGLYPLLTTERAHDSRNSKLASIQEQLEAISTNDS
mmetsp:Transcript_24250/g.67183  ORF Transcript_24250/g.67183 Transcript_24250/m.67183 type:complete len:98 (+) Transcript_24250:404-697(+)